MAESVLVPVSMGIPVTLSVPESSGDGLAIIKTEQRVGARKRCQKKMDNFVVDDRRKMLKEGTVHFDSKTDCIVCLTKKRGDWIQCDECERWFHQNCIPNAFRKMMKKYVNSVDAKFTCHLCSV